jgi:glycosyltransferase involved in cell wall biosynthesis
MVHEPYLPMEGWRSSLIGAWQRSQLTALWLGVDVVFTSIEPWAEMLRAKLPRREVRHLPVGSNFPDRRSEGPRERERIGASDDALVIAAMGRDHPSWLGEYVVEAANVAHALGKPTVLLLLGADTPALSGLDPAIRVEAPGYLEPAELAGTLSAADIFLAPLIDGVSTRRGTLMVALQHGLPVVATSGPLTDPVLLRSGSALRLVPVGDPASFADEAARLAADREERTAVGAAARLLYEQNFDWPVIARKMLDSLPA